MLACKSEGGIYYISNCIQHMSPLILTLHYLHPDPFSSSSAIYIHRQVLHLLNLSPFPEPTPGSPELDRLSLFLFFHPDSGEQPGKDTLLTIQSESSNQMGSMLFCPQAKRLLP